MGYGIHLIKSAMLVPQPPSIITTDRSCGAWFVIPLNAELSHKKMRRVLQYGTFWLHSVAVNGHSCVFEKMKDWDKHER